MSNKGRYQESNQSSRCHYLHIRVVAIVCRVFNLGEFEGPLETAICLLLHNPALALIIALNLNKVISIVKWIDKANICVAWRDSVITLVSFFKFILIVPERLCLHLTIDFDNQVGTAISIV